MPLIQNKIEGRYCCSCHASVAIDEEIFHLASSKDDAIRQNRNLKKQYRFDETVVCVMCYKRMFKKLLAGPDEHCYLSVKELNERSRAEREGKK
jgi:hypothetical protein